MYPQNPYEPGRTPQQPAEPPTLSHSGPVVPLYPTPVQPSAYSEQPYQQPPTPAPVQPDTPAPQPAPLSSVPHPGYEPRDEFSIDYLNQIAPTQQKPVNRLAVFGLIGGILAAAAIAVVLLTSSGGATPSTQMQQTLARIGTLQTVADAQQKHLAENDINQANATLSSALSSMKTDLTAIMKTKGVKVADKKSASTTTETAYLTKLQKKLDDSYQRGTLDRTYTSQMTYELTLLRSKLKKLQSGSDSKSLTAFCTSAITNVDAILKAYANFTETK